MMYVLFALRHFWVYTFINSSFGGIQILIKCCDLIQAVGKIWYDQV
jgi:hypothetical protein